MSASREKKQRQQTSQEVKLSRAQEEQTKAVRRKRNTIIYTIIGIVVVILVAALLIWNSGVFQRKAIVATIDDEQFTGAHVAFYYYDNPIIQNAEAYSQWGYSNYPFSLSKTPQEQTITTEVADELGIDASYAGKTFHDLFLDDALKSLQREYVLRKAAKEANYTLSDEGKASVQAQLDGLKTSIDQYVTYYGVNLSKSAYLQMVYGDSMDLNKFRTCLENAALADEYYAEHFDDLADYTKEELNTYYEANKTTLDTTVFYYRYFDGTPEVKKDEDGKSITPTEAETKAALEAAKAEAEKAKNEVDKDFNSVKDNKDYTKQSGVLSPGSFYYNWLVDPERKEGDTTILDGNSGIGYYLIVFEDRYLETSHTVDLRHILISAMPVDNPDTKDKDESKDAPSDSDYAAAEKKAQEMLDQWKKDGSSLEKFAELATKNSADAGSKNNGGLYEAVAKDSMVKSFNDWIFDAERKAGDTGLVKNTDSSIKGWHIIYYIGENDPVWETSARIGLWNDEVEDAVKVVTTDKLDSVFA